MPAEMLTIAFVSGKGGVGKTMLASNFAWVCGQLTKTLLVDLDFQNQGATGLFAPHVQFSQSNALDAIKNPQDEQAREPILVPEGISFLPSVGWEKATSQDEIARCVNAPDFREKLGAFSQKMHQQFGFGIVILDCHGGVDAVSLAAYQTCDYVLMVTEADSVTFNGTLELLNYYNTKTRDPGSSLAIDDRARAAAKVRFIVNRLPSKYRWKDLDRIYRGFLKKGRGILSADDCVFSFIPVEESLADSFGEYPFYARLAPGAIFTKKICFMAYCLVQPTFPRQTRYKPLAKFERPRYRRKIERVVISYEQKNIQYILKFFAWFSTLLALGLLVGAMFSIHDYLHESSHPTAVKELAQSIATTHMLSVIAYLFATATLAPLLWYPLRATFGLMFIYREKHRFQKALFKAVSPNLSLWQRMSLLKLLVLRIGTTFIPAILVIWVLFLAVLVVASELNR